MLQIIKSVKNGFNDNLLISQPNPMMWPSLKSSLQDDSNKWWHHRVWLRHKKVSILKTVNFRPYPLPWKVIQKASKKAFFITYNYLSEENKINERHITVGSDYLPVFQMCQYFLTKAFSHCGVWAIRNSGVENERRKRCLKNNINFIVGCYLIHCDSGVLVHDKFNTMTKIPMPYRGIQSWF